MRVRRLGQSAFTLTAGSTSVLIDPFDDDLEERLAARGVLDAFARDERRMLDAAALETGELPGGDAPLAVVPKL